MSILIKGMNKPKNCHVCEFNSSDCFCKLNHGGIDRDDWSCDEPCPIIEVSDLHGQLIDADVVNKIKKGGIYRHHKGGLYRVIGIVKHTETQEVLVAYRPLSGHNMTTWVRPIAMFCGTVDGKPRFEEVAQITARTVVQI